MKKLFVVLVVLVLLLALTSGCTNKPKDDCEGKDAPALGSDKNSTDTNAHTSVQSTDTNIHN